jgi:Uma2 family endonuclease
MTLADYLATPETVLPQELIDGVIRVADAPIVSHQRVVFALARAVQAYAESHDGGEVLIAPTDVILDGERDLVLQPDLVYVSPDRSSIVRDRIHGAPDLVVEVLSPRPRIGTLGERLRWFAHYGVREIWLYHQTDRRLDVLECQDGRADAVNEFGLDHPVRSQVLPLFARTMRSVLSIL